MPTPVFGLRLSDEDRMRIDARRREFRGMSRAEYMRLAALGELPSTLTANERLEMLEQDVERLWEYVKH